MRSRARKMVNRTSGRRSRLGAVGALLPLALSMIPSRVPTTQPVNAIQPTAPVTVSRRTAPPKEFSIPISNLRDWASSVIVTFNDVRVEGHSKVHPQDDDCEIHLGAHTPAFQGNPDGLVLEPMNSCIQPFPGKTEQKNADWTSFADQIIGTTVTASGVPRIWPEHLSGGGASNPDHAVELHPLTALISVGKSFDFAPNIFADVYHGGVGEPTALSIVQQTSVSVIRNGDSADISFNGGRIGNFTTLSIVIDRPSIAADGSGSFRMNGGVILEDNSTVPVRIVTIKGSPINDEIQRLQSTRRAQINMEEALVLFSLSPEALLEAVNKSNGNPVAVERPIQLILYGTPDS